VFEIYTDAQRTDARARDLLRHAEQHATRVIPSDGERLDKMVGTRRHQGVVARIDGRRKELKLQDVLDTLEGPALFLVLDGIQDPHNLGACLRVADAAGAHAVIAPKDRAVARALRELQEAGVWVLGAAGEADKTIYEVDQKASVAWVLGAEGDGLRRLTRDTCDSLVKIPMYGTVESLNVSVASGLCLFETRRQRQA
jgi:23S rRNA (guanosine2251-2'-O)-methyltransferase